MDIGGGKMFAYVGRHHKERGLLRCGYQRIEGDLLYDSGSRGNAALATTESEQGNLSAFF